MSLLPHETPPLPGPAADLGAAIRAAIPVIETEHLRLRAPELADFPVVAEICTGTRSEGLGGPMSREDAWFEFAQMVATWALRGHGYWTVTDISDGSVFGFVGIGFEPGDREPELGYFFAEAAEGRGIAFEAASAAREHAFGAMRLPSLVSYVFAGNDRSIALARRLGAAEDTPADWDEPDTRVFRHPMPEALQ